MSETGRYRVVMPDDGWDNREVSFWCPLCERTVVWRSFYLNLDALLAMGMTQAEFAQAIHDNDEHPELFAATPDPGSGPGSPEEGDE